MKVGVVIPIFNRANYVKQCFDSLLKLTVKPDVIVLVDDASTDKELQDYLCSLRQSDFGCHMICITNEKNHGVRYSLQVGIEKLIDFGCRNFINLDSDAIVKPDFVEILTRIWSAMNVAKNNGSIVSGFNVDSDKNKVIEDFEIFCTKPHANGINMCFNKAQYEKYIKPSLLKEGNWDYNTSLACQADNLPFIITTPSVVQHIGVQSSMGHHGGDFAQDFKQLSLPNVTLFGIDSHDKAGIERAATISQRDIDYGAIKVITDDLFTPNGGNEQRRKDYSKFMLKELTKHFNTSHVLTIHADGYVLDWEAWDDSFLEFDFIGGTWLYKDGMNVGNGGFSLRSKKLCDILASNDIDEGLMHPEDHCICRTYRKSLEKNFGIRFAPEEVANRFSIEAYGSAAIKGANKYSGQFGFHGVHVDFTDAELPKDVIYNTKPQLVSRVDQVRELQRRNLTGYRG